MNGLFVGNYIPVPSSSVETYKSVWPQYADKITT